MKYALFPKYKNDFGRLLMLALVLVLSTSFLCFSSQLYIQSIQSAERIEETNTTIAYMQNTLSETEFDMATMSMRDVQKAAVYRRKAMAFDAVEREHAGVTRIAHVRDYEPVYPSPELQESRPGSLTTIVAGSVGVFRVRVDEACERYEQIERSRQINGIDYSVDRDFYRWDITGTITETLYLSDQLRQPPEKLLIYCEITCDADGVPYVFETGKEYVFVCEYTASGYDDAYTPEVEPAPASVNAHMTHPGMSLSSTDYPEDYHTLVFDDGTYANVFGSLRGFPLVMMPDDPMVERMVEWAKKQTALVPVTGISTVEALPLFATDKAYLAKGRDINQLDNTKANRVCLVSNSYANHNGLELGDSITVDMYPETLYNSNGTTQFYYVDEYTGDWDDKETLEYTIVGIYQTQEWVNSNLAFSPNTVFVPETTIPERLLKEEENGMLFASSLILKNGSNEQFLSEALTAGIPEDTFLINDGGYVQYMKSLEYMQQDTGTVLLVCFVLFLVLNIAAINMTVIHLKCDTDIMLKFGASRSYVYRYMLMCLLPVVILSAVAAYGLSYAAYGPLMETIEKMYIVVKPEYSNLTEGQLGALTRNLNDYPSLIGVGVSIFLGTLISVLMSLSCLGRRKAR